MVGREKERDREKVERGNQGRERNEHGEKIGGERKREKDGDRSRIIYSGFQCVSLDLIGL